MRALCRQAVRARLASLRVLCRRNASTPTAFRWEDPLNFFSFLTEEEQTIQETAH